MAILIVISSLMGLLLLGSPVVLAIASASLLYFFIKPGMLGIIAIYPHKFFTGMDSFVFLCIPLFVMAGEIMKRNGMVSDLVNFSQAIVGHYRGGMAYVNVLVSMIFGGITGSGLADVSALGPTEITAMKEDGYDTAFAAALTATSAIQGPIIPPSIPMVIYSSLTNASIGALFLAGAVPGVMIGMGQMIVILLLANKKKFPKRRGKFSVRKLLHVGKKSIYALMMPVIIIGGIVTGIFTATEAAAVAVGYVSLITFTIYRKVVKLNLKDIYNILNDTAKTSTQIYLIVGFASILGWIFAIEKVPFYISYFVESNNFSVYFLLFLVNIFFLFNGMWISDIIQLVLFAPIFTPMFASLGIHPVHFGVIMVVNVMVSMITPPYGTALYLASAISGESLRNIVRETIPFTAVSILVLFIITYFPKIVMFLPKMFKFI